MSEIQGDIENKINGLLCIECNQRKKKRDHDTLCAYCRQIKEKKKSAISKAWKDDKRKLEDLLFKVAVQKENKKRKDNFHKEYNAAQNILRDNIKNYFYINI